MTSNAGKCSTVPLTGPQIDEGEKHQKISSVNSRLTQQDGTHKSNNSAAAVSEGRLGPHRVAQFGGILCVTQAVNQHKWISLVVLDDVGDTAEILLPFLLSPQSVLLSCCYKADWDVVHSALVKHH